MNKLGHYIFKRICKDQALMKNKRPMNMYGLFVNTKDIQNYIIDYVNYGIDYTGDDNISADDKVEHYLEDFLEPNIERYWDEPEGDES
jgi:hypothetical protein